MNQEELNQKFLVFEQRIRQVQEQLGAIEQAILDLNQIDLELGDLIGKVGEEIMSPIEIGRAHV